MWNKRMLALLIALCLPGIGHAMPAVEATTLPRGVALWVMEDHTLPIVSMAFTFDAAGSISDPAGKEGLARLSAEMLTKGAGRYDALGFEEALAELAITLDISTDDDTLTVQLRCLREFVPQALKLVQLALASPNFDVTELARAQAQQQSQLKNMLENPAYRATEQWSQRAYQGHPYAQPALGNEASVAAITQSDLRAYQQTYLTAANLAITAAGDITAADLSEALSSLVKALPEGLSGQNSVAAATMQGNGEVVRYAMRVPQSRVVFGLPWPKRTDDDFYAAYILQTLLGGSPLNSVLASAVRQKDGLVYDIGTQLEIREGGTVLVGQAATRNANVETLMARIKEVFSALQQKGVSQQQCEDAKAYIVGSMPIQLDSTRNMVAMLAMMQHENLGTDYLERRRELFESVRCTEVSEAATNWLNPEHILFSIAGGVAE